MYNIGCARPVSWEYSERALQKIDPVPESSAPPRGIKMRGPWMHIPGESAAKTPGEARLHSRCTRRAVLVSKVESARAEWGDSNGREEIWRELGGTAVAEWLGDSDSSERCDGKDYRTSPQYTAPLFLILNGSRPNSRPAKTDFVRIVVRIIRPQGRPGDVLIVGDG